MAGLVGLTSRIAVLDAMAEFDAIGRSAFLKKYGFREARSYFLRFEGSDYDSKAIVGAAVGYQTGTPLRGAAFVGGNDTVAPKLKQLGFDVVRVEPGYVPASVSKLRWTRDGLILLLDLYRRRRGNLMAEGDADAQDLIRTLDELDLALGAEEGGGRTLAALNVKVRNFRAFDPAFPEKLAWAVPTALESEVWRDLADDPERLASVAASIRQVLVASAGQDPLGIETGELGGVEEAPEGRALTVRHLRRERSLALVQTKKERALARAGKLACEACGFDFAVRYGPRGDGFIECHHTRPVSELGEEGSTKLEDLALLCANCHRMVHARRPWLSVGQVRALLHLAP